MSKLTLKTEGDTYVVVTRRFAAAVRFNLMPLRSRPSHPNDARVYIGSAIESASRQCFADVRDRGRPDSSAGSLRMSAQSWSTMS